MIRNTISNIGGAIVRENETYTVQDNTDLETLSLSSTLLHPNKSTSGHKHDGQEEIYFFHRGKGIMQLDEETVKVGPGDVISIPAGVFHRVFNTEPSLEMYFVCVFNGARSN